ncbi:MAG: hypothetical protein H0T97_09790 [Actinobacteria bacterium]|nr:hypothetical protein [Actinomycetota bacterium]
MESPDAPRMRGRALFSDASSMPGLGGRLTLVFGLLLAVSALTGWYTGEGEGTTVSVIGWHTGTIGKVVLFLGLVAALLVIVREFGVDLPDAVPASLVAIGIGSIATVLVLVRLISIPDTFFFASRGIGIWVSLVCAIGIIVAGLLEASEEL